MKHISTLFSFIALFFIPLVSVAQETGNTQASTDSGGTLTASIQSFIAFLDTTIIPLIFAIAFIVFLYYTFRYFIWGGGQGESRETGAQFVLYALIGFVLMFSLWGIVKLLQRSVGFSDTDARPSTPVFNREAGS